MDANVKEYPQFTVDNSDGISVGSLSRFDSFRHAPSVHNRVSAPEGFALIPNGVRFNCAVKARVSKLAYTHETALYLYGNAEPGLKQLYLTIEFWSENVFRVSLTRDGTLKDRLRGLPPEGHMLVGAPQEVEFTLSETDSEYVLATDKIQVRVSRGDGAVSARRSDGAEFFAQYRSGFKAADVYDMAITTSSDGDAAAFEALKLGSGELIYGLGERFDALVRNGRRVDFHNKDAVGTTSPRTYVNVPFYISTRGYGLFVNSTAPLDWQPGTLDAGALQFAALDDQLDYFVIAGDSPKQILHDYCGLTGFSQLPPLWSFGLWMSRNSYTSWDVVDQIAAQTRKYDIPCDVLHLDTAWFSEDWNCDLKFSPERFPEPEKHLAALRNKGFHVSLWQYNFIPPRANNTNYIEAAERGYLAVDGAGKPYHLPPECKGSWVDDVIIDFSNPAARAWYAEKIEGLMRMGAAAIKTDFGEGIPEQAHYANVDGKFFHNAYSLIYNATVSGAVKRATGDDVVWARSGTAGSQRYPLHWGGDSQCTFDALAGTLRGALSVGISGIPFFSHDIGGFIGMPDDELYIRWAQLGLFSSHSRCHGAGDNTYREPWRFSQQALEIFRRYAKLRYSLMPYIYAQAAECVRTGLPMMRALYLEYPDDRNVWHIDDQYMFGDSLLIAPVLRPLSESAVREIYLPRGVWFDYFTKARIESRGEWIRRDVDLQTMPIYVKQGAVLKYCNADTTLADGMGECVKIEEWL